MFAMTHPVKWFSHLDPGDKLAAIILASLIAALLIIAAVSPDTSILKAGKVSESGSLYQLSPIPPGAK
jgi:hypothetical protein